MEQQQQVRNDLLKENACKLDMLEEREKLAKEEIGVLSEKVCVFLRE